MGFLSDIVSDAKHRSSANRRMDGLGSTIFDNISSNAVNSFQPKSMLDSERDTVDIIAEPAKNEKIKNTVVGKEIDDLSLSGDVTQDSAWKEDVDGNTMQRPEFVSPDVVAPRTIDAHGQDASHANDEIGYNEYATAVNVKPAPIDANHTETTITNDTNGQNVK